MEEVDGMYGRKTIRKTEREENMGLRSRSWTGGLLVLGLCGLLLQGIFYSVRLCAVKEVSARKAVLEKGAFEDSVQEGIAGEILRFHVLANSDSEQDQALKMAVKARIVDDMKELLAGADSIEETRDRVRENLEYIRREAEDEIKSQGYSYAVQAKLESCYFPVKSYGDCTFPAGNYQALRILIGEARGHNWWCVLYPNLCFVDSIHAVVPEEEKQELRHVLTEEEYDSLFDWQEDEYKIRSGFLRMWERILLR